MGLPVPRLAVRYRGRRDLRSGGRSAGPGRLEVDLSPSQAVPASRPEPPGVRAAPWCIAAAPCRAASAARSEEHTSELQSLMRTSYAVFCLKKKKKKYRNTNEHRTHKTYETDSL